MKTLLILRHGKSSWNHLELADHDRPLKKRGRQNAWRMGELISDESIVPDVIFSSTAKRASETAVLVCEAAGLENRIVYDRSLYHGSSIDFCELLMSQEDDCEIIMVVGHNPGLEELLSDLTGANEWMPTAALAQVEFEINSWSDLNLDIRGELKNFWVPRALS